MLVREPAAMLESVLRIPFAGQRSITVSVAAEHGPENPLRVDVGFRGDELNELRIETDALVQVADAKAPEQMHGEPLEIGPGDGYRWTKSPQRPEAFGGDRVDAFYIANVSPDGQSSQVQIYFATGPAYPQARAVLVTALGVMAIYLLYTLQAVLMPRTSAIALVTTKSEIAQPLYAILLLAGTFFIFLFLFLPYNTFGEDIKMLKDSGLTLIMILAIIQGVWAASNSVAEEIEGKTALTVLSKPIGRRRFLLGKWLGIVWTVMSMFLILGTIFLIVVAYKPIYDAREMGGDTPPWTLSHLETMRTVPGLLLAFFETVVISSISVAISTRLPLLANFAICFSIYVLGHLTPLIVQSPNQFPPVVFVGQFIATLLPVLDHFNIQGAVASGKPVPLDYLGWTFLYCAIYSTIALLIGLALFEDRDLA